jgi:hypothetical protein
MKEFYLVKPSFAGPADVGAERVDQEENLTGAIKRALDLSIVDEVVVRRFKVSEKDQAK